MIVLRPVPRDTTETQSVKAERDGSTAVNSSRPTSLRRALVTVGIVLATMIVAVGGFAVGRSGGQSLSNARAAGTRVGEAQGDRAGSQAGYHSTYRAAYHSAYQRAHAAAYHRSFRTASR
jgi:hypothetical protein